MTGIQKFEFDGLAEVRVVTIDGEPWFVANDVCSVLGYRKASDTTRYLEDDERRVITSDDVSAGQPEGVIFAPRKGNLRQSVTLVSEPGLYSLIMNSQRPEAKRFKRWITHEVLPTIRKTGGAYIAPGSQAELDLTDPDTALDKLIEVAQVAKQERAKRLEAEALAARKAEELEAAKPKTLAAEGAEERFGGEAVGHLRGWIANEFGIKTNDVYPVLRLIGAVEKRGKGHIATPEWSDTLFNREIVHSGEVHVETTPRVRPGKQQEFLDRVKREYTKLVVRSR